MRDQPAPLMNEREETETPEGWVHVGHYSTLEQAYDHGLVVLAMGEACRVEPAATPGEFDLQAEVLPATKISEELDAYARETEASRRVSRPMRELFPYSAGWPLAALWIFTLLVAFIWKAKDPGIVDLAASSSTGLFSRGEWWRPFTALFFHADIPHLTGNILGGAIFGVLVSRSMGPLRGWLAILAAGTLGNILTAWANYPAQFLAIGASTAVFGALGILSGLGIAETFRDRAQLPLARIAAPVVAGVVLLSWLGSGNGDGNTDVVGHVLGFGSGLLVGSATGLVVQDRSLGAFSA